MSAPLLLPGDQVLVFVHSRKETAKTARFIKDHALKEDKLARFVKADRCVLQRGQEGELKVQNKDHALKKDKLACLVKADRCVLQRERDTAESAYQGPCVKRFLFKKQSAESRTPGVVSQAGLQLESA